MALYLKNATYIDWKTHEFRQCHLKVEEGPRGGIEFVEKIPEHALDCHGKLVTKSFACAHHHVYSALARGMPPPSRNPRNFLEILQYIWWNLDKQLDSDMIQASALACALSCAKNGVTFVIDHHASPFAVENSLEIIAESFEKVGVGHLLCYELSDRDGLESRNLALQETERYLTARSGLVGLHASFTVGDELLKQAVSLAEKYHSGIHIHVAEDAADEEHSVREYGCRVIERLNRAGVLDFEKSILAHCIHLDRKERELLSESKAFLVINVESNLNNAVGQFTSAGLPEDRIMLGTDGMHSDMIRSAQAAYFQGISVDHIGMAQAYERLRRVHAYLSTNTITGDGENNLVLLDYDTPTPVHQENWMGHLFYGLNSAHVSDVISAGKLIVRDRTLLTVDQNEILEFARAQGERLWRKLG